MVFINDIGGYSVGKEINRGTFGIVNECEHVQTGKRCVVKVVSKDSGRNSDVEDNPLNEISTLKKCNHKNIIKLLDVVEDRNNLYMFLEPSDGGDLLNKIMEKESLSENEAHTYFIQILDAVQHLHSLGITHRDLKLENLLLNDDETEIRLIDFGMSSNEEVMRAQCGSPSYAAPEILLRRPYTQACDVWSMGVILYTMIYGEFPYACHKSNPLHTAEKITNGHIKFPRDSSAQLQDLISGMLCVDVQNRYTLEQVSDHRWTKSFDHDQPSNTKLSSPSRSRSSSAFSSLTNSKSASSSFSSLQTSLSSVQHRDDSDCL